jgi:Ca2+-transporting ATPase
MWKSILSQAVLQFTIIFLLIFGGPRLFPGWDTITTKTMVFNTFVCLQIFNEINCRRLDDRVNVFSGIPQNLFFIGVVAVMIVGQILIISVGGIVFSVTPLNRQHWFISIALGFLALPFGAIVRVIPNDFIRMFIPKCILPRRTDHNDEERQIEDFNDTIEAFHEQDLANSFRR